ncbi:hypothetical protein KY359_00340 [Candidatus Woesearchaeota archaeon]|nr:hypothetical protein [Candidatus Woesearchaeota archaeon]
MKQTKTKKKVSHKPSLEADVSAAEHAHTCKACEMSHPLSCPFCTKEGLLLIVAAIILIAVNNTWTRYAAWIFLLGAFLVPLARNLFKSSRS